MNLRKLVIIIAYIIGAVIIFLAIRGIQTAPLSEIPSAGQLGSPAEPSTPEESTAPVAKEEYPKRIVVGLRSWSDIESAKQIITESNGKIIEVLKWPEDDGSIIVAIVPDKEAEQKILRNSFWGKLIGGIGLTSFGNRINGGIDFLVKDPEVKTHEINVAGQAVDWAVIKVQADKVWGTSQGQGVKVAIIDSGVDTTHPDLAGDIKGGVNFTTNLADGIIHPEQWNNDELGHGTRMAGIIAAVDNNIGVVGIAPKAELYALKTNGGLESQGSTINTLKAIRWTGDNGMNIANMSIGTDLSALDSYSRSYWSNQYAQALDYAYDRGVVLIASSGNNGDKNEAVSWPAAYDKVIAVGATDKDNNIAYFSNHGSEVDLVAPGVRSISTAVTGEKAPTEIDKIYISGAGSYSTAMGTSDSAPIVSGVAALIKARYPQMTPAQIREQLESTALDLGTPGKDEYFGSGLVNAYGSVLQVPPTKISLIYPRGGENWTEGMRQEVRWSAANVPSDQTLEKVDIQLVHENAGNLTRTHVFGSFYKTTGAPAYSEIISLALDVPNTGKTLLNVPANLPISNIDSYFLEINCGRTYPAECESARSGALNFEALPPQLFTIISPNGGEQWPQGTSQSVLWSANYFGELNVNVDLLEKKQIPTYTFIDGSQTIQCTDPLGYCKDFHGVWGSISLYSSHIDRDPDANPLPAPPDTCNGNIAKQSSGGLFTCPATNTTDHLSCTDVWGTQIPDMYWARIVDCSYQAGPPYSDSLELVKSLAKNVPNSGSAEISAPNDLIGNNYFVQLSCANYTGECVKGLSNSAFNIIRLRNPRILTINKSGSNGMISDGNTVCSGDVCYKSYEQGTVVILQPPKPSNPLYTFSRWSGVCSGAGECRITMDGDRSVTAVFVKSFIEGTKAITLRAVADPDSIFTGWSGACLASGECFIANNNCPTEVPCDITMEKDQDVKANFIINPDFVPLCFQDDWSCPPFSLADSCVDSIRTRTCVKTFDCPGVDTENPFPTTESCSSQIDPDGSLKPDGGSQFIPGNIREVNP